MKLFSLPRNAAPVPVYQFAGFGGTPATSYPAYSRAYMNNEIVFSAIELLASSASEPRIIGRRYQRNSPQIRNEEMRLRARGYSIGDIKRSLIENGFYRDLPDHPLVKLLNNPNPFMSRGQLWGTVVMDRCLAGNAYLVKARFQDGPLKGAVSELWRLRPDRVKIIPSAVNFIEGYEYNTGRDKIVFQPSDVMHFKTRNPLNEYYGQPPLMAASGRIDIDDYMKSFLRTFFERGGAGPGSILTVKQKMTQEQKDQIRARFRGQFGGSSGFHELMILDAAESTYQQMGLNRGLRDALPKELDAMQEARIAMVFGIPGSILGLLIGYESSSYANKRQDWQVFWDLTMTPLLSDFDDVLNLSLVPEFGLIDDVCFDLSDIRALQEDVDKLHQRAREDWLAGGITWPEYREELGRSADVAADEVVAMPSNIQTQTVGTLGEAPEPVVPQLPPPEPQNIVAEVHCPQCNRWIGRNLNVGGEAYCPQHKGVPVVDPGAEPRVISINVVRDDEGRVAQLVGAES